ncbi:hypothetical protein M9H77_07652 [Catharanthus roseus]|uniref:Uncharacterized protein n=1 Tax=Catharanthus roseus TaxID=4058 RepID=A0ACC0BVJ1_CATRO|nr:hypothetical protein M9H77_07652 [Catharanthus roseus]
MYRNIPVYNCCEAGFYYTQKRQMITLNVASPPYEGLFRWRGRFRLGRVDPLEVGHRPRRLVLTTRTGLDSDDLVLGSGLSPWSPNMTLHISLNSGVETALCVLIRSNLLAALGTFMSVQTSINWDIQRQGCGNMSGMKMVRESAQDLALMRKSIFQQNETLKRDMRGSGEKVDRQRMEIAKLKGGHRWRKHEPLSDARRDGDDGRRHGSRGDRREMWGERNRWENDGRDWRKRELESFEKEVLSCENSEVMEENSKEGKLVEAKEEEASQAPAATLECLRTFCDEVNTKNQAQHHEDKIERDSNTNHLKEIGHDKATTRHYQGHSSHSWESSSSSKDGRYYEYLEFEDIPRVKNRRYMNSISRPIYHHLKDMIQCQKDGEKPAKTH